MGAFENMLAELRREKQAAFDTQQFTYHFRVFVPNTAYHTPSSLQGWPMAVPGKARLRFRCENDAHFLIESISASVYGPVYYSPSLVEGSQLLKLDPQGATVFPLPGLPDPYPVDSRVITAVSTVTSLMTLTGGSTPKVRHPVLFEVDPGSTLPAPLQLGRLYYIETRAGDSIRVAEDPFGIHTVTLTDTGSGTFYAKLIPTIDSVGSNTITMNAPYNVKRGQPVFFQAESPDSVPGGLEPNVCYYAIPGESGTFKVAESPKNAIAGTAKNITAHSGACYIMFAGSRAERGVSVGMYDHSKVDRLITSDGSGSLGFVPMDALFPPAYGTHHPGPFNIGYILPKRHEFVMEFRNRDLAGGMVAEEGASNGDWCHVVNVAFKGVQFFD